MSSELDEWIAGAQRQRRSILIYQRPDLVANLDEINQEMSNAKAAGLPTDELEERWTTYAQLFADSALRIVVEGQTIEEINAIKAESTACGEDDEEASARILAAAIVSPTFTAEQILALRKAVGDAQVEAILAAWRSASFDVPPLGPRPDEVSADE